MKYLLLLLCSIPFIVKSQIYLPRYSYAIAGFEVQNFKNSVGDLRTTGGTVFFLRWKDALFLITAKHVFTGCERGKKIRQPEILQVWIPKMKKFYAIINKTIQDTAHCADFGEDADILVLRVNDSLKNYVNTVDSFINNPYDKTGAILISGFPKDYIHSHGVASDSSQTQVIKSKKYTITRATNYENSLDTFNFYISTKEIQIDQSQQGYSGSPVFFQKRNSKAWRIGAVDVGYTIVNSIHYMILCDFKYALQKIKEMGY